MNVINNRDMEMGCQHGQPMIVSAGEKIDTGVDGVTKEVIGNFSAL